MERRSVHLAFASDAACAVALGIAVFSLLRVQPAGIRYVFHVLDGGIPARVQKQIKQLATEAETVVHFMPVNGRLGDLPCGGRFPTAVYHRFLLPELLPGEVERVLYLDADLLACRDVTPVYDTDLCGKPVGAPAWQVIGPYEREMGDLLRGFCSRMGIPEDGEPYFYSSQLLMDLTQMRREQIGERLIVAARNADPAALAWPDQDILNKELRGCIATLPCACNVMPLFAAAVRERTIRIAEPRIYDDDEMKQAWADPILIHYAARKPNPFRGPQDEYDEHFFASWRKSPWRFRIPYVPEGLREMSEHSPALVACLLAPAQLLTPSLVLLRAYGHLLMAAGRRRKKI